MDDSVSEAIVNRDEPIPVVSITAPSETPTDAASSRSPSRRHALKQSLSAERLKEKLEGLGGRAERKSSSMQDRLFNMLLQQVIPPEGGDGPSKVDRRSRKYVDRPGFSLPAMSTNFRRFNARIGVAFVFQNRLIRLFTWRAPTHTLSFLAAYTFVCLDPYLLAVLPVAACLLFIMVPAFLTRHPPPPTDSSTDIHPLQGPPLAPPRHIKPAPELSKDFFRNMRDLQNSMEDFSRVHDKTIELLAPPTNFSNEALSSAIFLFLFALANFLFIAANKLPWRAIFLFSGWAATCAGHPRFVAFMEANKADKILEQQEERTVPPIKKFIDDDIDLSSAPETREVEIFELQKRNLHVWNSEYEPWVFSPSHFAPGEPSRIAGDRPKGTRFFEDVQAPPGWRWADKKWTLDLLNREWVEDRYVTGVEVELEGERWVTDISYDEDDLGEELDGLVAHGVARKGKEKVVTWEEGHGQGKKGEWRRRRWVRVVERRPLGTPKGGI